MSSILPAGVSFPSQSGAASMINGRGMMMHFLLYGLNFYGELNQLRQQHKDNRFPVFYYSKALTNV